MMNINKAYWMLAVIGTVAAMPLLKAEAGVYGSGPNGGFVVRGPARTVVKGPNGNYAYTRRPVYPAPVVVAPAPAAAAPARVGVVTTAAVLTPAPAAAYSATVASVQRGLKKLGYYKGAIDGIAGPATESAIRRYQAAHGLPVTGEINAVLIRTLRM